MAKMTAEEKRHVQSVAEMGCIVCEIFLGIDDTPTAIHHIRAGNGMSQRDHYRVLPFCPQHHQHGADAFHRSKADFERKFATENQLLKIILKRL